MQLLWHSSAQKRQDPGCQAKLTVVQGADNCSACCDITLLTLLFRWLKSFLACRAYLPASVHAPRQVLVHTLVTLQYDLSCLQVK